MKKEYDLSEEEARELQQKMCQVDIIFVSGVKSLHYDSGSYVTSFFRIRMTETRQTLKWRRK